MDFFTFWLASCVLATALIIVTVLVDITMTRSITLAIGTATKKTLLAVAMGILIPGIQQLLIIYILWYLFTFWRWYATKI